jgi:hypothetical protein
MSLPPRQGGFMIISQNPAAGRMTPASVPAPKDWVHLKPEKLKMKNAESLCL